MATTTKTITIGTGTSTGYNAPYNNYYKNSTNMCIYTAAELGLSDYTNIKITSIAYNVASSNSYAMTSLKIYMAHKSSSTFSSTSDYVAYSDMTLVYSSSSKTIGASTGWETITLDTPFSYNGTDNLVIIVCHQASSFTSSLKYYYTSVTDTVLYRQNDSTTGYADPSSTSYSYTKVATRPNIQIGVSYTTVEPPTAPTGLTQTAQTLSSYTITWNSVSNATGYKLYEDGVLIRTSTGTTYTKSGLLPATSHTYYVVAYNSGGDSAQSETLTASTTFAYYTNQPVFKSISITPNPASTSASLAISVEVDTELIILEPTYFYSGELYSGEADA
jgi:hypothetical protein